MTSVKDILKFLPYVDMVLMMSVEPGFSGQKYRPEVIDRVKEVNEFIKENNLNCLIQVDGGVSDKNVNELREAGVDVVVSGSFIFNHPKGVAAGIEALK